jgi:hypothetical protein
LLIAKLDRLARNVHFISGLMETGVPFVAADMPTALVHAAHLRGHGSNAAVPAGPILHTIQFGVGTTIGGALMRRLGFLTRVPDRWQSQTLCPGPIASALFLKTQNWHAPVSLSMRPKPRIRRGWQYAGGDDVWRQRSNGHWWPSNCGE